LAYKII
jgi:hypothetical protein